jgi:hypothetical protein
MSFSPLDWANARGKCCEVLKGFYPVVANTLKEPVQYIGGGARVIKCSVRW